MTHKNTDLSKYFLGNLSRHRLFFGMFGSLILRLSICLLVLFKVEYLNSFCHHIIVYFICDNSAHIINKIIIIVVCFE